jgi:hypothetical protein
MVKHILLKAGVLYLSPVAFTKGSSLFTSPMEERVKVKSKKEILLATEYKTKAGCHDPAT